MTAPAAPPAGGALPVALVGLPGTGKSSVARVLAARLGRRLVDLDEEIERRTGLTVPALFAEAGEGGFRQLELEALTGALEAGDAAVIACGGGVVTRPEARRLLEERCTAVWLDAPDDVLLARIGDAAERPLLAGDPPARLASLRAERRAHFAAVAPVRVDVSGAELDEVADRVVDAVSGRRLRPPAAGSHAGDRPPAPPSRAVSDAPAPGPPADAVVRVEVPSVGRDYPVLVGAPAASVAELLPERARRVAVVCDRAVLPVGRGVLAAVRAGGRSGGIVCARGGERLKTWGHAGRLVSALSRLGLERGDAVVAVGGGTVGDVAGFAAATYLRGVAVLHVPTTLLAMVDSAVGGKTGVNLARGKNLAGAFWAPHAVVCDVTTLGTLGRRQHAAAIAEVVKYAMVDDEPALTGVVDSALDALLERDRATVIATVRACVTVKARVVAADEREQTGVRALLNYGHTVGHALEAVTGYERLLHGEAVAVGMRVAARLGSALLGCPAADVAWQDDVLGRCGLGSVAGLRADTVLAATRSDKKRRAGVVRWVLPERRGRARTGVEVPDALALEAIGEVLSG